MDFKCFFCGSELIWGSDFNLEEVCGFAEEGDGGVASYYTCPTCGRTYECATLQKKSARPVIKNIGMKIN